MQRGFMYGAYVLRRGVEGLICLSMVALLVVVGVRLVYLIAAAPPFASLHGWIVWASAWAGLASALTGSCSLSWQRRWVRACLAQAHMLRKGEEHTSA